MIESHQREYGKDSPDYSGLSFKELLVSGPTFDDLELTRSADSGRDVSFLYDDGGESH